MLKQLSRYLRTVLAATAIMIMGAVSAQAYLQGTSGSPRLVAPGEPTDFLTTPNWAYTPPIRKFIDTLPLPNTPNNLGQFLPIAVADTTTYPGSDYYVIKLVEFETKMHTDLPPTRLRGYVQLDSTDETTQLTTPQFLGPVIIAQKDRPVRVKFINGLPTGEGGQLFIPVDQTIMGSGDYEIDYDPITKEQVQPAGTTVTGKFAQNRGELHLHGGRTPWISDGTPHQWITPAGEDPNYSQGVSVVNVSDMPDPGPGAQTYYWTNQQSARLMFYHDHAWGITRLNVYVGEAAGYVIEDPTEQALISAGTLPADMIPLVIEDKTYVDATPTPNPYGGADVPAIYLTDPTWRWGTGASIGTINEFGQTVTVHEPKTGDLWWPHVYMPAQNPFDITGIAPMGRWAYGPYFWPATNNPYQPVPNPYFNVDCNVNNPAQNEADTFGYTTINGVPYCQPPEVPSTPNPSWGAEAFMDTPTVNGTAYPVLNIEPKAYRLRFLNASHDRFVNLQIYEADTVVQADVNHCNGVTITGCDQLTEVAMVPAVDNTGAGAPATWPTDGRAGGVPDWTKAGPEWVMYASEGGFLPQPVVIPHQPVDWNVDVTTFNAGNVNAGSLILGPAERADVVVDFTGMQGKTFILYNDAPAPWPAIDPHYDYYTGDPDNTDIGGAPPTLAGFGPNTRTIMKIVIGTNTSGSGNFNLANLQTAFTPTAPAVGVFQQGQDPLIAGQGDMNPGGDPALYEAFPFNGYPYDAIDNAYQSFFPTSYPNWGVARINDKGINFIGTNGDTTYAYDPTDLTPAPWDPTGTTPLLGRLPMKFKAIQDEQGETFDDYGRMRAGLGLELVNPGAGVVNFIIQTYSDPATEILEENGIQVWKITHNGVDTHPIHFHLYDIQVLNRVGWDGFIRLPDPTEMGWKDTLRISPLEDTIVALKPVTPRVPFGVPESIRPLNPARPAFTTTEQTELTQIDPFTGEARVNINRLYNLDWEYVWHCHILSHEENDMMRPQSFLFGETQSLPPVLSAALAPSGIDLTWTDPTPVDYLTQTTGFGDHDGEIGFRVERCTGAGCSDFAPIGTTLANQTTYTDTTAINGTEYNYQVVAYNANFETASNVFSATLLTAVSPSVVWVPATSTNGSIFVSWAGNSSPAGATIVLEEATDSVFATASVVYTGTDRGVMLTGRTNGTYYYRVKATFAGYNDGLWTVGTNPCVINMTVLNPSYMYVPAASSNGSIALGWGASNTAGVTYVVEESTDPGFATVTQVYNGTNRSTTLTGKTSATYYYRVKAIKTGWNDSAWVNGPNGCVVNVTVLAPSYMWNPAASNFGGSIPLGWGASNTAGVTYVVEESTDPGYATTIQVYSGTNRSTTVVRTTGTYYYRVKAIKAGMTDSAYVNGPTGCVVP